ncbi:MAG: hypothetical protein AAFZ15_10785 [Bacteroidota bacterium]
MKINTTVFLFLSILFVTACQVDRTIPPITEKNDYKIRGYKNLAPRNKLKMAKDEEPGERLVICGKLIWNDDKRPLNNQLIHFYQTDQSGDYQQSNPDDEKTARLRGELITNDLGMFYLETILPGSYGSSDDNRHIHTTVFGANPEAYDLHFKQHTGYLGRKSVARNDQQFLIDLSRKGDGTLVGFVTMEIMQ